MARLWHNNPETPEGKYLVVRRDGTIPEWPYIVLGAADRAAPIALHALADAAQMHGMDREYVKDLHELAAQFVRWREENWTGNPDGERHRTDDPATIEKMKQAKGA